MSGIAIRNVVKDFPNGVRAVDDVSLDIGANEIIQLITTIVVVLGMFVVLAPSVAWMTILPMPFIIYGSLLFQRRLAPHYAAVREQVGILNSVLGNNLSGIATVAWGRNLWPVMIAHGLTDTLGFTLLYLGQPIS